MQKINDWSLCAGLILNRKSRSDLNLVEFKHTRGAVRLTRGVFIEKKNKEKELLSSFLDEII